MPCNVQIDAPANDPCAFQSFVVGKQIPILLYQEMSGVIPTSMATKAGLQAGLSATGDDQLFILKNLAASTTPAPTDQTLGGNDVPYGGEINTDRLNKAEFQMQYLTAADIVVNNALAKSQSPKRVWFVDDMDVLQGPIENAYFTIGGYLRGTIGTSAPNRQSITVSWRGLDVPLLGAAPVAGVRTLVNA